MLNTIPIDQIRFVKEFYPRLRENEAAIERYRATINLLPPITVARDSILVDGYHRWQANKREGKLEIEAENLGNLSDLEIKKEAYKRNNDHGVPLETKEKRNGADDLYRSGIHDYAEIADLLGLTVATAQEYCREARHDEREAQKAKAWDLWLNCLSEREIADAIGVTQPAINGWVRDKISNGLDFLSPPESRQHFDIWSFQDGGEGSYFGRMPPQIVENLLWFYTKPGNIVFDPFAGSGTTIDVAKIMGRRVWASDREPSTPMLPIHEHNILDGWPNDAPRKVKLILLDPPYWQQAKGRYSNDERDLANVDLKTFYILWRDIVSICIDHLEDDGYLAYIIGPTQCEDETVVDHATDMLPFCQTAGLKVHRRIIVPYSTQQVNGQQVTWARKKRRMLKLYRDLVVLSCKKEGL